MGWAGSSAGSLEPSLKKTRVSFFSGKKKTQFPSPSLEGHSRVWTCSSSRRTPQPPVPRLFTLPPHLTDPPKSRSPSHPNSISLPRGASKGDAGRDGAPPRRRRRREPGFRSISSLPPTGTHSLARAAPVWFVEVRGIGQGLTSFIRWMDVCRFSVDLAPGDV